MSDIHVHPETLLPDLFDECPEARSVFNRYGLRGCGGTRGPAESIEFFARTHGVDPDRLIAEIRNVVESAGAREEARRQLDAEARPRLADSIYCPFFLAGMAVVLTAGAAWGVLLLWKISVAGSFAGVRVQEVNAHGHAQIMGWVALFIMGFAYQAFPRMWQVGLPAPGVSVAVLAAALLGILGRSASMLFDATPWADPVHAAGATAQIAAVVTFVTQIGVAFQRSRQPTKPYVGFIFAALGFMLIQCVYSAWHTTRLMGAPDRDSLLDQIAVFQAPLRDMQIHGMAMLMIFGVGIRMFPAMFGLPEVGAKRGWWAWHLLVGAVVLEIGAFLAFQLTGVQALAGLLLVPWILLPIGAALIVWPWCLWRPMAEAGGADRSAKFIRTAFAWLFISFAMLLLMPLYQVVSATAFSHAYHGAVRHAVTVGFVSMMIVGMGAKVVPTLRGIDPRTLPALWSPFVLLNVGCMLRVSLQILTDWTPAAFRLVPASGVLEWLALAIWAGHLGAIMLGAARYRTASQRNDLPPPSRIEPEHCVGAVLDWFPALEPQFIEAGFDLIRNPVLRRTVARQVSLRQACRMKGVDVEPFVAELNRVREQDPRAVHVP